MKIILSILKLFSKNTYILGACSISTLISFLMTIYVSIKTKSIQNVLSDYKRVEKFNREGPKYRKSFKSYQDSLIEDNVPFRKIKIEILNDLRIAKNKFNDTLNRKEKKAMQEIISKIEYSATDDVEGIANELSKVIAIFSVEKES